MRGTRRLRLVLLGASVLGAISPVTLSKSGAIVPARVCADGTCCREDKSLCFINGIRTENAYYKGTGPCQEQT